MQSKNSGFVHPNAKREKKKVNHLGGVEKPILSLSHFPHFGC